MPVKSNFEKNAQFRSKKTESRESLVVIAKKQCRILCGIANEIVTSHKN